MIETTNFYEVQAGKRTAFAKKAASEEAAIHDELVKQQLAAETEKYKERLKKEAEFQSKLRKARLAGDEQAVKDHQAELDRLQQLDEDYLKAVDKLREDAAKINQIRQLNIAKKLNAAQRRERAKEVAKELKEAQELAQAKLELAKETGDKGAQESAEKELAQLQQQIDQANAAATQLSAAAKLLDAKAREDVRKNRKEQSEEAVYDAYAKIEEAQRKIAEEERLRYDIESQFQDKLAKAREEGDEKAVQAIKDELDEKLKNDKEYQAAYEAASDARIELEQQNNEFLKAGLKDLGNDIKDNLSKAAGKAVEKTKDALDDNLQTLFGSQGKMMGRLQGTAIDWKKTVDSVSDTIGLSGIVSKKSVVSRMTQLVDEGVAYNLEMRAFLAETSQNIAATFNATNGTLLRMIRLQQADTTAARLGMEATLTRLFNQFFTDTSYLANDVSETVSGAIMDAAATRSKNESLEFEYAVQKWLGSLYSVGMSDSAVSLIAEGINYLGTGNVGALSQNESLQTLFAMSASRAGGKSFSDMLTTGLTAEDTNSLLKAMVEYLAEIATSQSNYVTKSAYANLFGMSITDLTTFASLTANDIDQLYKSTVSYNSLMDETQNQLKQISSRMSITELVTNAIDNAEAGAAANIGSNAFTYGMWKALSLLKDYVGEIKIPSILAAGFGLSSDIDLLNVAQTGLVGMGLIGSLLEGVGSIFAGGATNMDRWGFNEYTTRGQNGGGLSLLDTSALKSTSYSAVLGVGSASGDDVSNTSLTSAVDKAKETQSEESQEQADYLKNLSEAVGEKDGNTVIDILADISEKLSPNRVFYTAMVGMLSSEAAKKVTDVAAKVETSKDTLRVTTSEETFTNNSVKGVFQNSAASNPLSGFTNGLGYSESDSKLQAIITEAIRVALTESFPFTTLDIANNTGGKF